MELMSENTALNTSPASKSPGMTENAVDPNTEAMPTVELQARTLDWDENLPEWVTSNHPNLIMYVHLLTP